MCSPVREQRKGSSHSFSRTLFLSLLSSPSFFFLSLRANPLTPMKTRRGKCSRCHRTPLPYLSLLDISLPSFLPSCPSFAESLPYALSNGAAATGCGSSYVQRAWTPLPSGRKCRLPRGGHLCEPPPVAAAPARQRRRRRRRRRRQQRRR